MIKIVNFLMKQTLFIKLLVVLILITGYMTISSINREAIPEVNFDMVSILTIYPGGSPDELEQLISMPIEKKLREVDGLDKVRAYNIENVSVVAVYLDDRASDKKQVVQDIKDSIDKIDNFPDKAEKPIVNEIKTDKTRSINVAIFGKKANTSYKKIRETADNLEEFFYDINGVADVEDFGYYDREYLVEVNPSALTKYRLGLNRVIGILAMRNLDLPGGALRIGDKEFVLRTKGQYKNADEIRNTVIMSNDMGYVIRVKDIAKVTDTFKEADVFERVNGKEAIVFKIWKKRSADEIELVDNIKESLKNFKYKNSDIVNVELFNDQSELTRRRISSVTENAVIGFILLMIILLFLLGPRMSAIVAAGIPISFMIAFMGMKGGDITINVISLFAMIMVLGMIVDFSIVVSENSHRYMESGLSKLHAIEEGVKEVFWPVTVTFLCICSAFAPLLFLTGIMGKFITAIPTVLMICLAASWYIAMFILPAFLNMFIKVEPKHASEEMHFEDKNYEAGVFGKVQKRYKFFLAGAIRHRYLTLTLLILMLIGSIGLIKVVGFIFMPGGGAEQLEIKTRMPQETNLAANLKEVKKVEKIIMKLPKGEFMALYDRVGMEVPYGLDPKPGEGTHKTTYTIYLTPEKERERTADEILVQVKKKILAAQKKGMVSKKINFEFSVKEMGPPIGKPINVEIRGKDFAVLKKIAKEYTDYLKSVKGVHDVSLDLEEGKQEYRYIINEVMASRTDVSVYSVAMALHGSFEGAVATSVRKGEEDIDVRVRFPEWARKRMKSLKDVKIGTGKGGLIPLNLVTNVEKQPGYSAINRLNYKRIVQVQAQVDKEVITSMVANRKLAEKFKDIEKRYPGYHIAYGGEQEDTDRNMGELGDLFIIAILVIFIILAVFFESLALPLVVMSAIPFALVGVVLALFTHGEVFSFMSVLGLFSLAGVIVSNTLVLVQFINNQRDTGLSLKDAIIEGGVIRLRPVILTTGTTVLGLFPTIYAISGKDYFVAPLALAFGYGLIFATFITLVLVPCFYHIAEDLKGIFARTFSVVGINMTRTIYTPKIEPIGVIEDEPVVKPKKKRKKKSE